MTTLTELFEHYDLIGHSRIKNEPQVQGDMEYRLTVTSIDPETGLFFAIGYGPKIENLQPLNAYTGQFSGVKKCDTISHKRDFSMQKTLIYPAYDIHDVTRIAPGDIYTGSLYLINNKLLFEAIGGTFDDSTDRRFEITLDDIIRRKGRSALEQPINIALNF